MMENYQETCIKSDRTEQLELICQTNIMENENCRSVVSNEENYNFGAEITKTNVGDCNSVENKTVISTSTKTDQLESTCATATIDSAVDYDTSEDIGEDDVDEDEDEDDSSTSTDSDFSDFSGLSDVSGKEWKPINRKPILWVQKQIHSGRNPRELLSRFLPAGATSIALGLNDMSLWRLLANMLSEPPRRQKLRYVNTFEDVIQLILKSQNIVVLTGAGVSVSCGIPDFRSSDGIYSRLAKDYPNLPDPQAMFDIDYFSRDPRPFYKFAREIYPGQFKPSPCHRFIKLLEDKQRLLRNYTQNIDTLEQVAGIKRVIECHGSFSTASCTKCKYKCDADAIREDIFAQRIPVCPRCQPCVQQSVDASEPVSEYGLRLLVANGIMKPDIVFFGEGLPEEFHKVMASDKDKCDLLIVIGSSLKVRPVALIPSSLPAHVPQILINREQLNHLEFDVELLGDSDVIINQICHRLGDDWKQICFDKSILQESKELRPFEVNEDSDENQDLVDQPVENYDDERQSQDTDTQSVASADIGFQSSAAGTCSESGFESCTSIGQIENNLLNKNDDELAQIENIKTNVLNLHNSSNTTENERFDFQPFNVRLDQDTQMTPPTTTTAYASSSCVESVRHLSIDSTKDSGIQCDSSNSITTPTTIGVEIDYNETACSSSRAAIKSVTDTNVKTQTKTTESVEDAKRRGKSKASSAADFLMEGTYYYHKNSSSYVFPGAQISWYADDNSETDFDEEQEYHENETDVQNQNGEVNEHEHVNKNENEETRKKCDTIEMISNESKEDQHDHSIVSPLRNENSNNKISNAPKRRSSLISNNDDLNNDDNDEDLGTLQTKKCRSTVQNFESATAILTTTINTTTNTNKCNNTENLELLNTTTTASTTTILTTVTDSKESLQDF